MAVRCDLFQCTAAEKQDYPELLGMRDPDEEMWTVGRHWIETSAWSVVYVAQRATNSSQKWLFDKEIL